jgi:hypothetical protein
MLQGSLDTRPCSSAVFALDQPANGVPKSPGSTNVPGARRRRPGAIRSKWRVGPLRRATCGNALVGPVARNGPGREVCRNLPPGHSTDLATALTGQDQQPDNSGVGCSSVAGRPQNLGHRRGRALAFPMPLETGRSAKGLVLDHAPLDGPSKGYAVAGEKSEPQKGWEGACGSENSILAYRALTIPK